jgi:uncharacterized membrane protein
MNVAATLTVVLALLGSALIGGVFFAFSSFVMTALGRLPSSEGMAAMQSINVVVLNRSFLGAFMGTALVSLLAAVLAGVAWNAPAAWFVIAGALSYLVGTFLVTGIGNVPLNERLAEASNDDPDAMPVWDDYLDRWTRLNTVRTVAAMVASVLLIAGLMLRGA